MVPDPLHPAVVHFPIVFVVLLPIVAIVMLLLIRRGAPARATWLAVPVLAVLLLGSSWMAVQTGEREEEAVEDIVGDSPMHEHEENAEFFLFAAALMAALAAAGLANGRVGQVARPVATVAALLLTVAGYRVGHTGGELVYEYGAASAYVDGASRSGGAERGESRNHDDDDDDDDDDRGERDVGG